MRRHLGGASRIQLLFLCMWMLQEYECNYLYVKKIECKSFDPLFCSFRLCEVKRSDGNTLMSVNVAVLYKHPIDDIVANINLIKPLRSNVNFMTIFNTTVDFCAFMRNQQSNRFFKLLIGDILKSSNINHSCPYQHDIIVDRFVIDKKTWQEIHAPNGAYIFKVRFIVFKVLRAEVKLFVDKID